MEALSPFSDKAQLRYAPLSGKVEAREVPMYGYQPHLARHAKWSGPKQRAVQEERQTRTFSLRKVATVPAQPDLTGTESCIIRVPRTVS